MEQKTFYAKNGETLSEKQMSLRRFIEYNAGVRWNEEESFDDYVAAWKPVAVANKERREMEKAADEAAKEKREKEAAALFKPKRARAKNTDASSAVRCDFDLIDKERKRLGWTTTYMNNVVLGKSKSFVSGRRPYGTMDMSDVQKLIDAGMSKGIYVIAELVPVEKPKPLNATMDEVVSAFNTLDVMLPCIHSDALKAFCEFTGKDMAAVVTDAIGEYLNRRRDALEVLE